MRRQQMLFLLFFLLSSVSAAAQDEPEYRMEIGGGVGLTAYEGDFNGSPLKGMQPRVALLAKYKMNPRMAWAAQLSTGQLKGSSKDVKTWYPEWNDNPVDFTTSMTDFSVRYEYNFWPFGTGKEYLGARPLTPFITLGAGLLFSGKPKLKSAVPPVAEPESAVALQMPIGLGVKYKLRDRLNLTAEWVMHFSGTDKLDGVVDPYGIKSSGLFKNTDCYSVLQVSLTYDIWAKCKTCHNDRD
ncbi:MAG: outer membrane beta-barrel protein [Prevotella sp.]|nr:outer membrane beta-barrel protein [Prevotella sp.]